MPAAEKGSASTEAKRPKSASKMPTDDAAKGAKTTRLRSRRYDAECKVRKGAKTTRLLRCTRDRPLTGLKTPT